MLNKKLTGVLLGGLIFSLAIYANSLSQTLPTENLSFSLQVTSLADTHCVAVPGDVNGDNKVNLTDVCLYSSCISGGGCDIIPPYCRYDINGDGLILSVADLVGLVRYIFNDAPPPVKSDVCCLSPYFPSRKTPYVK